MTDWADELRRTLDDEASLDFASFGHSDAWAVGSRIVEIGRADNLPIAISIVLGEQRVFHAALTGSSAVNDAWLARKIRVVSSHDRSSYGVGCEYRATDRDFDTDSRYDPALYAAHGGGVPIRVGGSLIGVVCVSGLAEKDDHDLVVRVLRAHLTP